MKISASLTYDQPQTNERRDNQKDIRDDNALLLLMYDPDSQSQSDQNVSASEQRPLHGLLQCQPARSERTDIPRSDRIQKLTITASPERPILRRTVSQISKVAIDSRITIATTDRQGMYKNLNPSRGRGEGCGDIATLETSSGRIQPAFTLQSQP